MTSKILTILIVAVALAGSAAAALQATNASLAPAAVCAAHPSRGALVFVMAPPTDRFAVNASGLTPRTPRIVLLTPPPRSVAD
jgi:hypothetical protein